MTTSQIAPAPAPEPALAPVIMAQLPAPGAGIATRILYFMRTVDCPICRAHVRRLAELQPTLRQRGAEVLVLAPPAGTEWAADWIARQPFPVLVIEGAHAAAGFDRAALGTIQQSGTLLIDLEGRVLLARRSAAPFLAFQEGELLAALESVDPTEALPGTAA